MARTRSSISRAHITNFVLDTVEVADWPVGDADTPKGVPFGWQGEPNDTGSNFIPWTAVIAGVARPTGGDFGDAATEHVCSYNVTFNAVDREQCDALADLTRKVLMDAERVLIDCGVYGNWKVQQVRNTTIGGILKVRTTEPDYYVQTDAYDIWVSKERGS